MITTKVFDLILQRVDFSNDELENLVEIAITESAAATKAALEMENVVLSEYSEDEEARTKALEIAGGIVDFSSEIGSAFPSLTPAQVERFKALFATVFESPSPAIETVGETLFNASVDTLQAIQSLVTFVNNQE